MSFDKLQLCEHIVETQLGSAILEPVARILIRSGSRSLNDLTRQVEDIVPASKAPLEVKNALTVMIKHNLLRTTFHQFQN